MPYTVLVTGSREWRHPILLEGILVAAYAKAGKPENFTVRHGAARGVDTLADNVAGRHRWKRDVHPVTPLAWKTMGKRAGPLRNQHMVNLGADLCLAFIRDHSPGATGCARLAEAADIPTRRYFDCSCHSLHGDPTGE